MMRTLQALLMLLVCLLTNSTATLADDTGCAEGVELQHTYPSSAQWSLCVNAHPMHGIDISQARYRAPGDSSRSVLHAAHLAQVLVHYHDQPQAVAQIHAEPLANHKLLPMTDNNCDAERLLVRDGAARLCSRVQIAPTLARYAQRASLHGQSWELTAALQRDSLVWAVSITFTEDGSITPAVSLSGRAEQLGTDTRYAEPVSQTSQGVTRASILTTWRMVFDLDTPGDDTLEQFEFPLLGSLGNRRPMQVTRLQTETYAKVDRESFRGWRIVDTSSSGYYLDPSNSGFNYRSNQYNWAQFDVAITRYKSCERYAVGNITSEPDCGESLDDFMSGETLAGAHPVLWFSQNRILNPSNEDWPVISNFYQSFTILPFDWTPSSPFEINE